MSKIRLDLILVLILLLVKTVPAHVHKIEQDYASGKITYIEKVTYLGYRVFAPEKLPQIYRSESGTPIKCATGIVAEIKNSMESLNPDDQQFFQKVLARPILDKYFISPSSRFKLHYNETGFDAVPLKDLNQSGIPDYIEEAAEIFEFCYRLEVDTLGYNPPPSDFNNDGPEIDIYFQNLYSAYGWTNFEDEVSNTPYNDMTSYLILDNDFEGNFYTKGIEALKVTFAHEFFHMIQGGYYIGFVNSDFKDRFFYEMSSVWMEERAYTEINDYYQYLPYFFSHSHYPLSYWNNNFEYGSAIFFIFIQQKYDQDIIRRAWEVIRDSYNNPNYNSLKALKAAFEKFGFSFEEALADFGVWNYFTGYRSNQLKFYKEANAYPIIEIGDSISFNSELSISDTCYSLTLNYHLLSPENAGNFVLRQSHDNSNNWRSGIIIDKVGPEIISPIHSQSIENLGQVNNFDKIILISANVEIPDALSNQLLNYSKSISQFNFSRELLVGKERLFPNPYISNLHQLLKIKVKIPKNSELDCSILSESGRLVYKYSLGTVQAGDALVQIPWDGKGDEGQDVSSGVYICLLNGDDFNIPFKFAFVRK